jgi:mycoredoxin
MDDDGGMPLTDDIARTAPLPIVVLGTSWCEDTAVVRSRLRALGVPFVEHDVEADPAAATRIRELNGGAQVTPTVVFGDAERVIAEPSLEQLGELLSAAGWTVQPPTAEQYRAPISERPIPLPPRTVKMVGDGSIEALRGRRPVALFLAHDAGCLACFGYARRIGRQGEAFAASDATPVVVVRSAPEAAHEWRDSLAASVVLVADRDGSWRNAIADQVGFGTDTVGLLILDRWHAARAGSMATEAGGLIDPSEAVRWLEFVELECPECAGEIPWESDRP